MGLLYSTYYGLVRINELGPQTKGWAVTDTNFDVISLLLNANTQHRHSAATPLAYPGYNLSAPATPTRPTITEVTGTSDGALPPGTSVGVRLAFVDAYGLETDGSPETQINLAALPVRPNAPSIGQPYATPATAAVTGGTYIYGITKRKGTGETVISDTVAVNVPYDPTLITTYAVPISFNAVTSFGDGSDSIRIYRATGYNSSFVLLKTVTDTVATSYVDDNTVENSSAAPPTVNTFDKNKKVKIDLSRVATPGAAKRLKVYVTQQPLVYGTNNLLADWDLTNSSTPVPVYQYYKGSEILGKGYPKDFSQTVGSPPKIYLRTDATGAPLLTEHMDFNGYQAQRFVLGNQSTTTPIPGMIYLDWSTNQIKFIDVNKGAQTLTTPTGVYIHPNAENGGHVSQNIIFAPGNNNSGPSVRSILSIIATPVGIGDGSDLKMRKQVQGVSKPAATTSDPTTSSGAASDLAEMTATVSPDFAGQWMEVNFNGQFLNTATATTISCELSIDGILVDETTRGLFTATPNSVGTIPIYYATPVTRSNSVWKIQWWTSGGTARSIALRRTFVVKEIF